MIEYRIATKTDMKLLMESRLEMLRVVNNMTEQDCFSDELVNQSRKYFEEGDQTTVLALHEGKVIGCASISYIWIMPTFSHPGGKRAHLMNVYTNRAYRRQGIAQKMVGMLLEEARSKGVTEVSLDATESGRPLYERLGFKNSSEAMVLTIEKSS